MAFLCIGLLGGLLLTRHRSHIKTAWFWSGVLIAFMIFLPHIVWEIKYDFPTLEFLRNRQQDTHTVMPFRFFFDQVGEIGRVSFLLLLFGLIYYFIDKDGKQYRLLGWMYVIVFFEMIVGKGKAYYLAPVFPALLASGNVYIEKITRQYHVVWSRWIYLCLLVLVGIIDIPFAIPILPVETFLKYQEFFLATPRQDQKEKMGLIHQNFADMFGWEEMAVVVAKSYAKLTPEEQAQCTIITQNWGEAGAIDFFGTAYRLPPATCGHNSYWFWGPGNSTGEIVIHLGGSIQSLQREYRDVTQSDIFINTYCMPYENDMPVFICRGRYVPLKTIWPELKHFD
jgi:hypothetical protein